MNDTIYRQAAIDAIESIVAGARTIDDGLILIDKADAQAELMKLPSAQPEIIRCKDCKHLFEDNKCPLRTWWTHTEDDFCSYGERK